MTTTVLTTRVRAVARAHRLSPHDAEDVVQTTWLRLLEHHGQIRDAGAIGAWMQTTARHESLRLLRERTRVQPVDPDVLLARHEADTGLGTTLEATERREALGEAIETLPPSQRQVVQTLLAAPDVSYEAVARNLDMPMGSVGPTRTRALERLRSHARLAAVADAVDPDKTRDRAAQADPQVVGRTPGCSAGCRARILPTLPTRALPPRVRSLALEDLWRLYDRLEAFAAEMFDGAMRRAEQRTWGGVYLRGLLLEGDRKSIEPIATRLPEANEQSLQQFVNQSPWSSNRVRANLARRMTAELQPIAWTVSEVVVRKKGRCSVGVARQYSAGLGRVDNCQIGVSIDAAAPDGSCPLNWRLALPKCWDDDALRRRKAHVPHDVRHVALWQLALDAIDAVCAWGLQAPPIVAPVAGFGEIPGFVSGLEARGLRYLVEVRGTQRAWCATGDCSAAALSLADLAHRAHELALARLPRRDRRWIQARANYVALRVQPQSVGPSAGARPAGPPRWLLAASSPGEPGPGRYWLSNLAADCWPRQLVELAEVAADVQRAQRALKDELGLDHFEGRSFRGWHHHTTLVSVAHAFLTRERLAARPRTAGPQAARIPDLYDALASRHR